MDKPPSPRAPMLDNVPQQSHHAKGLVDIRKAMGRLVRNSFTTYFAGRTLPTTVL